MKAEVISTGSQCTEEIARNKDVVVIDVLRATTVIVTALQNGATSVVPFMTIEEVQHYAKDRSNKILGGERNAHKIVSFDCGNSPLEYTKSVVEGKEIVLTTTNGTKAINHAKTADHLYVMCFLNCAAVVDRLIQDHEDIVLLCAGTKGKFSTDDSLCAGYCLHLLSEKTDIELDDAGAFLRDFYRMSDRNIHKLVQHSRHYNLLKNRGYADDLEYCFQTDISSVVPYYQNGKIIL